MTLCVVFHTCLQGESFVQLLLLICKQKSSPKKLARFFIQWGRQVRAASTLGMNAAHFARRYLDLLGIGSDLSLIKFGCNYGWPPSQLVSDSGPQPSTSA